MKSKIEIRNAIKISKKYKYISDEVIDRIINNLYDRYKNDKALVKEVKNKLHQIHEIFLNSDANAKVIPFLEENKYDDVLKLHMSTLERFGFYSEFYKEIFEVTGIPSSILDLACGYNPFSIKYMNLLDNFKYYAYDINEETSKILNEFFEKNKYDGISKTMDLTISVPSDKVEVAFLFKFLPLVEGQNKKFSTELLKRINANYIVVSFPTKSVTGRNVGMIGNYKDMFDDIISSEYDVLKEVLFENELLFIIRRRS